MAFKMKGSPINRNFSIRKIAEDRATKILKNFEGDNLKQKKNLKIKISLNIWHLWVQKLV